MKKLIIVLAIFTSFNASAFSIKDHNRIYDKSIAEISAKFPEIVKENTETIEEFRKNSLDSIKYHHKFAVRGMKKYCPNINLFDYCKKDDELYSCIKDNKDALLSKSKSEKCSHEINNRAKRATNYFTDERIINGIKIPEGSNFERSLDPNESIDPANSLISIYSFIIYNNIILAPSSILFENGKLRRADLAFNQIINDIPFKIGRVYFHDNGIIKSGKLASNTTINGNELTKYSYVFFDELGNLIKYNLAPKSPEPLKEGEVFNLEQTSVLINDGRLYNGVHYPFFLPIDYAITYDKNLLNNNTVRTKKILNKDEPITAVSKIKKFLHLFKDSEGNLFRAFVIDEEPLLSNRGCTHKYCKDVNKVFTQCKNKLCDISFILKHPDPEIKEEDIEKKIY